jgi:hypothetical protein
MCSADLPDGLRGKSVQSRKRKAVGLGDSGRSDGVRLPELPDTEANVSGWADRNPTGVDPWKTVSRHGNKIDGQADT